MRPQRWQPTRLPHAWDSPGKNTGVGCHFLLQCMKVKSESEVTQSCPTLSDPMDCSLPGSSVHGIFQARVLEWVAIAFSNSLAQKELNRRLEELLIRLCFHLLVRKSNTYQHVSDDLSGSVSLSWVGDSMRIFLVSTTFHMPLVIILLDNLSHIKTRTIERTLRIL